MRKVLLALTLVVLLLVSLAGCASSPADTASYNLSKEADQFKVFRRVSFYNSIKDVWLMTIDGFCSLGNFDAQRELTVTCRLQDGGYVKHFLGLSDNVTYVVQQLIGVDVSTLQYKVIYQPTAILPDIEWHIQEVPPEQAPVMPTQPAISTP